jgi:hypothetical protein
LQNRKQVNFMAWHRDAKVQQVPSDSITQMGHPGVSLELSSR